jgi:hypothetical protein
MSHSYPIWHDITACNYNSSKSYGSKDEATTVVSVGSSKTNSHRFVSHETIRTAFDTDNGRVVAFQFFVCGALIKECIFKAGRNDRPEELISEKCAYVGRVIHGRVKQSKVY